ncbi:metallophosphoesterase [Clostridium sp.]|uniref:metallophosphoesterase n=1 Tax=Clostridium sp. TaxID=1506 RepID=UPI0032173FC6
MIFITGDTHAEWPSRFSTSAFPEQKTLTKEDFVIVCGDFGIWDNSSKENYWLDWLDSKPFTTLFVSGNHSNYDILDTLPTSTWRNGKVNFIRPSVIHPKRGQIFDINNKTFFTFGGASSHDIQDGILETTDPNFKRRKKILDKNYSLYRINHISWWERELPSNEELQEGINNIKAAGNKVDYIITHSPYTSILNHLDGGFGLYKTDILTDYLQKIKENIEYTYWFFGHMHINRTFHEEKATCLYEQILKLNLTN